MKKEYMTPQAEALQFDPQMVICGSPESDSIDNMTKDAVNSIIWY